MLAVAGCQRRGTQLPPKAVEAGRAPRLSPDYTGCTVPPNIAPLNFVIKEPGTRYCVQVHSEQGNGFTVSARAPEVVMPEKEWAALLALNRGNQLCFDVYARNEDGCWRCFNAVTNTIADEEIDPYVSYRRIRPVHTIYTRMGTYQREMSSYRETPVLVSGPDSLRCVNCHSFVGGKPDRICLQVRSQTDGASMVVIDGETARKVNTQNEFNSAPASYTSWHPNGRLAAFASIEVIQFHHSTGNSRDVLDVASDLCLYLADSNKVTSVPAISDPGRLETFPSWSPDGKYLYFSSARKPWRHDRKKDESVPMNYRSIRYDLMRIAYDADSAEWGELETVLSSEEAGLSISEARVSPDGRFLLCCVCEYGCFPVFQESSDLYVVDLETGEHRALEVNSDRSDSWHCWSSNGRWIAFASKRGNGLFGRIYFSYVGADGRARKPVVLPQRDPGFYGSCLDNFNRPELAAGPIRIEPEALARVVAEAKKEDAPYVGSLDRDVPPRRTEEAEPRIEFAAEATEDNRRQAFRHFQSGQAAERTGNAGAAAEHYRRAASCLPALHPLNIPALKSLAWLLATHPSDKLRDSGQAVRLAGCALKSARLQLNRSPDERVRRTARTTIPSLSDTLAAALAEAGRFDEAVRMALEAETLALRRGQFDLAVHIRARLNLYLTGNPYRAGAAGSAARE